MLQRQVWQCLQSPLLHTVWQGAAATAPAWATAAAAQLPAGLVGASTVSSVGNWRGFAADATTGFPTDAAAPWSSGISRTGSRQVQSVDCCAVLLDRWGSMVVLNVTLNACHGLRHVGAWTWVAASMSLESTTMQIVLVPCNCFMVAAGGP